MELRGVNLSGVNIRATDGGGGSPVVANLVLEYLPSSYNGSFWVNTAGLDAWATPNGGVTFSATGANLVQTPSVAPYNPPLNDQYLVAQSVNGVTNFTGSSNYSVECWFRADNYNTASNILVSKHPYTGSPSNTPYHLELTVGINTTIGIYAIDNGQGIGGAANVSLNVWYQFLGVFEWTTNTCKTYLNGILQTTSDLSVITPTVGNNYDVTLGLQQNSSPVHRFWGDIGIFRIYSSALTGSEVLQNFNANKNIFGI